MKLFISPPENRPKFVPKSSQIHPQIIPNSSPNHPKIGPKSVQNLSKIGPKSIPNHTQIITFFIKNSFNFKFSEVLVVTPSKSSTRAFQWWYFPEIWTRLSLVYISLKVPPLHNYLAPLGRPVITARNLRWVMGGRFHPNIPHIPAKARWPNI